MSTALRSTALSWAGPVIVGSALGGVVVLASTLEARWLPLVVLATLAPFGALALRDVRRALLAAILLDIPLQFDAHLGYREDVSDLGALAGINVSVTTVALVVLYAIWGIQLLTKRPDTPRPAFRASLPAAAYLAVVTLSVSWARDPSLAVFSAALILQMYLLFLYVASTVRTREEVVFILTFLLIGLVLESSIIIVARVTGLDFNLLGARSRSFVDQAAPGENRVSGTLRSPAAAAAYLSQLTAPCVAVLVARFDHRLKMLALAALGLSGIALIFTLTRGGWIAAALSVALFCALAWHRGWLPPAVPLVLGLIVAGVGAVFQGSILIRFFGDDRGAALARVHLMSLAWNMIRDHPILGVGANNFAFVLPEYTTPEFGGKWLYTVHSAYYLTWAELGIFGLLAFVTFLLVAIARAWRVWRWRDRTLSPLALGFGTALVGHLSHLFVDVFNARPHFQPVWLVAGLLAALATGPTFRNR